MQKLMKPLRITSLQPGPENGSRSGVFKNFLVRQLALVFILMNLALTLQMASVNAQDAPTPPKPPSTFSPLEYLETIGIKTKLPNFTSEGVHPSAAAETKPGVAALTSPFYFAIDMFRYVISTIAFAVIIIASIRLVSTSNDEEAGKAKKTLIVGVVGLLLVQLAEIAVKQAFFGEQGEAFQDEGTARIYAEQTTEQIRGIIGFLEVFLGSVAVLVIIIKGFQLIVSGGEEEEITKTKKHLIYGAIGLVVVVLAEIIVRGFIFPENGGSLPKIEVGKKLIISITNYLAGFVALFAFIMLLYGGYRYVLSGGEDEVKEKVKKIIYGAVIALILALGAFAIVNTFLEVGEGPKTVDQLTQVRFYIA